MPHGSLTLFGRDQLHVLVHGLGGPGGVGDQGEDGAHGDDGGSHAQDGHIPVLVVGHAGLAVVPVREDRLHVLGGPGGVQFLKKASINVIFYSRKVFIAHPYTLNRTDSNTIKDVANEGHISPGC